MNVIKTTNQKIVITDKIKDKPDTSILVVYKSNSRKSEEIFIDKTIEQIEEIYKNWNNTLRSHEHKRTLMAYYSIYNVVRLTKIK